MRVKRGFVTFAAIMAAAGAVLITVLAIRCSLKDLLVFLAYSAKLEPEDTQTIIRFYSLPGTLLTIIVIAMLWILLSLFPALFIIWMLYRQAIIQISAPSKMDYKGFLEGSMPDTRGRYFSEIYRYSYSQLENRHDWIQRVFPTTEPSVHDISADPLTDEDIQALKSSKSAETSIRVMYERVLCFWQLNGELYKDQALRRRWNTETDHNHLRMTRVLKCFKELGMQEEFDDFSMRLKYIMEHPEYKLTNKTRDIWKALIEEQTAPGPQTENGQTHQ